VPNYTDTIKAASSWLLGAARYLVGQLSRYIAATAGVGPGPGAETERAMDRKDWTLLALASANGEPLTPVQLQKSLFILGREMPEQVGEDFYEFSPYDYGPFCADVYADAGELAANDLAAVEPSPGTRWNTYRATEDGVARARNLSRSVPAPARYLSDVVGWARKLSFSALVRAVYAKYPEMKANSVFRS
jgi:hypothetical protein